MRAEMKQNLTQNQIKVIPEFTLNLSNLQIYQKQPSQEIRKKQKDNNLSELFNKQIQKTKNEKKLRIPGKIINFKEELVSDLLEVFRPQQQNKYKSFQEKKELICVAIDTIYTSKYKQSYNSINVENPQFDDKTQLIKTLQKRYPSRRKIGSIKKYNIQKFTTPLKNSTRKTADNSSFQRFKCSNYYQNTERKINFDRQQIRYTSQDIQNFRKKSGMIK